MPLKNSQRILKICQNGEFLPNLVTLVGKRLFSVYIVTLNRSFYSLLYPIYQLPFTISIFFLRHTRRRYFLIFCQIVLRVQNWSKKNNITDRPTDEWLASIIFRCLYAIAIEIKAQTSHLSYLCCITVIAIKSRW